MYAILLRNKSISSNYSHFLRPWFLTTLNTTENSNDFKFFIREKRESSLYTHYIYHIRISRS